jgi:multicomponent Na+:H+ antiporter subunit D
VISDHYPALIVALPLILSFFVFVLGWFKKKYCFPVVIVAVGACVWFAFNILFKVLSGGVIHYRLGAWAPPWGIEYVVDHLNALILVCIAVISFFVTIYSKTNIASEVPEEKLPQFYTLFLLQITGLLGITITGDAFNLYVLLEIASFSAYALIGMGRRGAEFAAFRYMIFGTIGACAYLLGVGYLYIITGSLNMANLSELLPALYKSNPLIVGFSFLLVGVGIKMALFPVHTWLPDSYSLAPSAVSALLAPLFTKVGAYALIRVMFTIFEPSFSVSVFPVTTMLGWLAAIGMIFASVLALAQSDLKRMLCYLIVAEIGYIVIGVSSANRFGLTGSILHIVNDMFMMACLFTVAGAISSQTGATDIGRMNGLHRTMPVTLGVFVVGALSVIGIPPLCGFFSKWYLVLGLIQAKQWIFLAALLVSSLINIVLFFRIFEQTYLERRDDISGEHNYTRHAAVTLDKVSSGQLVPMVFFACAIILLGLFSGVIVDHIVQFAVPKSF